jgi:hypothetical protein
MAQSNFYNTVADASVSSVTSIVTTTLYLDKVNSGGETITNYRFFLAGNGRRDYKVLAAQVSQGSVTIPVTCNGQASFLVPAFGRWSDPVAVGGLSLPGYVDFVAVAALGVPRVAPITGGPSVPGVGVAVDNLHEDDIPVNIQTSLPVTFGAITVTDNTALAGDTLTINGIVYTFVNIPSGADNEIVIGATDLLTAESIASILHGAQGALLGAAASTHNPRQPLVLNFEGVNGATTWEEEARGLSPDLNYPGTISTARKKFGKSSLSSIYGNEVEISYIIPPITSDVDATLHGWFYWSGSAAMLSHAVSEKYGGGFGVAYLGYKNGDPFGSPGYDPSSIFTPLGIEIYDEWDDDDHVEDTYQILNYINGAGVPNVIIENAWNHLALILNSDEMYIAINGKVYRDGTPRYPLPEAQPGEYYDRVYLTGYTPPGSLGDEPVPGVSCNFDAWELVLEALWTEDFTPPATPPELRKNNVIVLDAGAGAMDWSTDSSGIYLSEVVYSATYTDSRPAATLPSLYSHGVSRAEEDIGSVSGRVNIPRMTVAASAGSTSSVTAETMPLLMANAYAYSEVDGSSDEDSWVSLLMYENDWMEWFSSIVVTGETADEIALSSIKYVATYISYDSEDEDNWKYPKTTVIDAKGDCEDGAFLAASLMLNAGVDPSRVRVYIGTLYPDAGHAWVEYRRESDEKWITLDWTDGFDYWEPISSLAELSPTYPSDTHVYIDASDYVTTGGRVSLSGEDYINSLQSTLSSSTLPLYTIEATTQNKGDVAASLPPMTASGKRSNQATANLSLPKLISSGLIDDLTGDVALILPRWTVSAEATQANIITLNKSIPALKASGRAVQLNYGIANIDLPALIVSARAIEDLNGDIAVILPMLAVRAEASQNGRGFASRILRHDYDTRGYVKAEIPRMEAA